MCIPNTPEKEKTEHDTMTIIKKEVSALAPLSKVEFVTTTKRIRGATLTTP